jgi:hypothetical protein
MLVAWFNGSPYTDEDTDTRADKSPGAHVPRPPICPKRVEACQLASLPACLGGWHRCTSLSLSLYTIRVAGCNLPRRTILNPHGPALAIGHRTVALWLVLNLFCANSGTGALNFAGATTVSASGTHQGEHGGYDCRTECPLRCRTATPALVPLD